MKRKRKNPHAVALGRLGGLVCSEAKRRANRKNGRKGGLVKSRKKKMAARRNADAHDLDAGRTPNRGSYGDSFAFRIRCYWSRLCRNPLFCSSAPLDFQLWGQWKAAGTQYNYRFSVPAAAE
jgi:hypothetical protein